MQGAAPARRVQQALRAGMEACRSVATILGNLRVTHTSNEGDNT